MQAPPPTSESKLLILFLAGSVAAHAAVLGINRLQNHAVVVPDPLEVAFEVDMSLEGVDDLQLDRGLTAEENAVAKRLLPQLPKTFTIKEEKRPETEEDVIPDFEAEKQRQKDRLAALKKAEQQRLEQQRLAEAAKKREEERRLAEKRRREQARLKAQRERERLAAQQRQAAQLRQEREAKQLQMKEALRRLALEKLRREKKLAQETQAQQKPKSSQVPKAGPGRLGDGKPRSKETNRYTEKMRKQIKQHYTLPQTFSSAVIDLQMILAIVVDAQGKLVSVRIHQSSKDPVFDDYGIQAATKAAPFDNPPVAIAGNTILLHIKR